MDAGPTVLEQAVSFHTDGSDMIKGFEFQDGNRKYTCTVETQRATPDDPWWWFAVSGDQQRYAPFRAESSDTRATVQERIVGFYTNRLFQLAQPRERGGHWGSRKKPVAAVETAAPLPEA